MHPSASSNQCGATAWPPMSFQNVTKGKSQDVRLLSCMCKWLYCSIFIASVCQRDIFIRARVLLVSRSEFLSNISIRKQMTDWRLSKPPKPNKNVPKSLTYRVFMIVTKMAFISIQTLGQMISNSLQMLCQADANALQTLCKLFSNALQTPFKRFRNPFKTLLNVIQTPSKPF